MPGSACKLRNRLPLSQTSASREEKAVDMGIVNMRKMMSLIKNSKLSMLRETPHAHESVPQTCPALTPWSGCSMTSTTILEVREPYGESM